MIGATQEELREGLRSFSGVYRRFNLHVNTTDVAYIDDYAHHPTELEAAIESVRQLYPGRCVIGVFQPHLYTRTRDFIDEFAQVLSCLDETVLLPIYPARELPIEGVTSEWLKDKVECQEKCVVSKEALAPYLKERVAKKLAAGKACVVMTMGLPDSRHAASTRR